MEVLQLIFNTIYSPILLITTISFLISQCGKKNEPPPDPTPQLKEPPYPNMQPNPEPGVIPTENQYIFFNYPYKRAPEAKPSQEKIAEMIAIREAAKDVETRRKWGEEWCLKESQKPKTKGNRVIPQCTKMPNIEEKV